MKKKALIMLVIVPFLLLSFSTAIKADSSPPSKKQTVLGLYITAKEAFMKWHTAPDDVKILDVRTPEEYIFIGHAPMACNIPVKFITHKWSSEDQKPVMPKNSDFVLQVKKRFKPTDTIMVMCRSGSRSALSINMLAQAGFKNVYNITDGFEGDKVKDPESYFEGKRLRNGWKNSGAPWTYKLDPKLMYLE